MGEIYNALNRHITPCFYDKYIRNPHGKINLHEENQDGTSSSSPYSVEFTLSENDIQDDILIIKDLEHLKSGYAKYIHIDPPKDCDYIIINETKQKIYFIELKKTDTHSNQSIKDQLCAGEKWLQHLLFCSHISDNHIDEWEKINIMVRYRPGRKMFNKASPKQVDDKKIYFVSGHTFPLSKFRIS